VLRAPSAARDRAKREFFADLEAVAAHLGNG
jgi:hypothetical protein